MYTRITFYWILISAMTMAGRSQTPDGELERNPAKARIAVQSDEPAMWNASTASVPRTSARGDGASPKALRSPATALTIPRQPSHITRPVPYDYEIGAGDILQVNVWREPEASVPSTVVRPDGKISLPLISDVSVVGLTPKQAEAMLAQELDRFINGAYVTVVVTAINSKKVYLVGAIKTEGALAYTYRMSVLQAISEGGGLTDYAKRKKIYVLRTQNGRQFRFPFDFDAVVKGQRMETNIALLPDDTVVVPY